MVKKDAEMIEREVGREGGKCFQGAAGSRSTQTDAVEQHWLGGAGRACMCLSVCVCVCAGGG